MSELRSANVFFHPCFKETYHVVRMVVEAWHEAVIGIRLAESNVLGPYFVITQQVVSQKWPQAANPPIGEPTEGTQRDCEKSSQALEALIQSTPYGLPLATHRYMHKSFVALANVGFDSGFWILGFVLVLNGASRHRGIEEWGQIAFGTRKIRTTFATDTLAC